MTDTKHTPTPWHASETGTVGGKIYLFGPVNKDGHAIAIGDTRTAHGRQNDEANAAFIVRAVSRDHVFDELVKAAEGIINSTDHSDDDRPLMVALRAALANAAKVSS